MKLILVLFTAFLCLLSQGFARNWESKSLEAMAHENAHPGCSLQNNCLLLKRLKSTFPLKTDKSEDNELNQFTWKYIYLYKGKLSVFHSPNKPPGFFPSREAPSQIDFLNNFPIESMKTPCNNLRTVCTLNEFKNQVAAPQEIDFQVIL